MSSFGRLQAETNRVGTDFLLAKLQTAFTYLDLAKSTSCAESRERNRAHARNVYDTVLRMQTRVVMEPRQKSEFQQRISDLRRRLEEEVR